MKKKAFNGKNGKKTKKNQPFPWRYFRFQGKFCVFFSSPFFLISRVRLRTHKTARLCASFFFNRPLPLTVAHFFCSMSRNSESERNPYFFSFGFLFVMGKFEIDKTLDIFGFFYCHSNRPFVRLNKLNCDITQYVWSGAENPVNTSIWIKTEIWTYNKKIMSECDCFSNAVDASNVNQFYMHQDFPIVVILVLREQKTQTNRGYINFYLWKHI